MTDRPVSDYVLWFDEYVDDHEPLVGGKNASLGTMIRAGLPVPPGFALTTTAYDTLRDHPRLVATINDTLEGLDHDDPVGLQHASTAMRRCIEELPLPSDIEADIRASYAALSAHCGVADVPVAVRSSGTAEDQPDASFAGQQDTFLWVVGGDAVVDRVRRCWSSIFTDRAIAYRRQTGYDHQVVSMSVGIQKMVDPRAAGVAFTLNPSNGDRSQVAIDAAWGLGESVVSGEVTPDNFLVDKVLHEITHRQVSKKGIEYRVVGDRVEVVELDDERATQQCVTDDELRMVAAMARRAEKHYGRPQDVEWAIDRHLPEGANVVLLQSRPETVWSNRPRQPIANGTSGMDSIVATLVSPLAARSAT